MKKAGLIIVLAAIMASCTGSQRGCGCPHNLGTMIQDGQEQAHITFYSALPAEFQQQN